MGSPALVFSPRPAKVLERSTQAAPTLRKGGRDGQRGQVSNTISPSPNSQLWCQNREEGGQECV